MEAKATVKPLVLAALALAASGCVFTFGESDETRLPGDGGLVDNGGGTGGMAGAGMAGGGMAGAGMAGGGMAGAGMAGGGMAGAGMAGGGMGEGGASPMPDAGPDTTAPLVRTCAESEDDDECVRCLKAQCCETWLGCDDTNCDSEAFGTFSCMAEIEFPTEKDYPQCVSASAASGKMLPQANTLGLLECVQEDADSDAGGGLSRCGNACLGLDL